MGGPSPLPPPLSLWTAPEERQGQVRGRQTRVDAGTFEFHQETWWGVGFRALEMETEKGDSGKGEGETQESPERHRHEAPCTREAHGCQLGSAYPDCCHSGSRTELTSSGWGEGGCWRSRLLLTLLSSPQPSEDPLYLKGTVL